MKSYILNLLKVILLLFLCLGCNDDTQTSSELGRTGISLEEGFLDPPTEAKPAIYYLFLNGYINRDYLGKELASLSEKGIGGLCVFDMGGRGNKEKPKLCI